MNQLERRQPAASAKERSEPAVAIQEARSYKESQAGAEAMKKSAGALSIDDISSDVIIQQEATVISRKIQQMRRDALDMESAVMTSALMSSQSAVGYQQMKRSARDEATSRKQQQHPVKSLYESAVAKSSSHWEFQAQRIEEVAKLSSRSDGSAAKQLTTYEELSKLDLNC
ncbi:hypothetical protein F511_25028 [Dorcoceras hygrometricum]|uniref:Uncharacterized protein n=1 Tax=Dorcoceras hygrometricum TaxID=472368 RepID=A0A2Z7BYG2_9LAMI|nr:hypothetical protein F511_25028 [Dorcoceras hygrometricum]